MIRYVMPTWVWAIFVFLVCATVTILLMGVVTCFADETMDISRAEVQELSIGTSISILECGIERIVPVNSAKMYELEPNGLETIHFDTDFNNIMDAVMKIPQGDPNRYPLFYFFSRTHPEHKPDIVYRDTKRDGTCDGIEVHWTSQNQPTKGKDTKSSWTPFSLAWSQLESFSLAH